MPTIDLGRVRGADGVGVPTGGNAGQILTKASNANHDTKWADIPKVEVDSTLKVSGKAADAKVTGDALGQLSQQMADYRTAVSLFDNGDFLIAQAGYGGMHGNTPYAADRWSMTAGLTVSHDGVGLTITKPTSLVWYSGFKQVVDIKHLKGKHVTMVAYCKTSNRMRFYAWGRDSDEDVHHSYATGNNSEDGVYTASVAIPSSLSDDYVTFSFAPDCDNTGAPVSKLRMALYPGVYDAETVPPYVPKGYANELLACEVAEKGDIFGMDLLWENAKPTDWFYAQSINIDLSGYPAVEIEFRHNSANESSVYRKCSTGMIGYTEVMEVYNAQIYIFTRQFTASNSKVEFMAGYTTVNGSTSESNERLVPVRIYGIKGVNV